MKFKVLPEPASVETIAETQAAVPLVPDREVSCCARLVDRTDVGARDAAVEWLTFLRALELVEEVDGRYRRLPHEADPGRLRRSFRERVYLADDALAVLAAADGLVGAGAQHARVVQRRCPPRPVEHGHTAARQARVDPQHPPADGL